MTLDEILERMKNYGIYSRNSSYTIKVDKITIGLVEVDYKKRTLKYEVKIKNINYDMILRRTLFEDLWKKI